MNANKDQKMLMSDVNSGFEKLSLQYLNDCSCLDVINIPYVDL